MVAWLLKCNISRLFFMNFNKYFRTHISCDQNRLLYLQNAHFILYGLGTFIFKYTSLYYFFMATKVNRSTKSDFFYKFQNIIIKKRITQKKK